MNAGACAAQAIVLTVQQAQQKVCVIEFIAKCGAIFAIEGNIEQVGGFVLKLHGFTH